MKKQIPSPPSLGERARVRGSRTLYHVTQYHVTQYHVTLYHVTQFRGQRHSSSLTAPDHGDITSVAPIFSPRLFGSCSTALGQA